MKNLILKTGVVAALCSASLFVTGCASIVHGDHQEFKVKSKPNHAVVVVDGQSVGSTPAKITLSRKSEHELKVSLPGYQTATLKLEHTMSGWFIANVLVGGLIGIAIDAFDGAMYELTPVQMQAYASEGRVNYSHDKDSITIILVHAADKRWKKIGTLKKK